MREAETAILSSREKPCLDNAGCVCSLHAGFLLLWYFVVLVGFAVVVFRCFSMHPKDSIQVLFLVLFFNGSF